ncbi:MAG: sialic acid TRAP transporter substrate-binding protein SiaP [Eubacteriales bacterium]|nr:sialic acid TRAP transporter substrate-binding protein SiaP [Eubacteriales bacterium]
MKKLIAFVLLAAMVLTLAACGGSGAQGAEKNVTLKIGFQANNGSNEYKAAELLAEKAKEYSNGTITVEIYGGGQLGDDRAMIDQVAAGALDMVFAETGRLGLWEPELEVFAYPFAFDDFDHMMRTLTETEYGKSINEKLEARGWKVLADAYNGTRQTTSNKPIESIEDMKGMKLRVPNAEQNLAFAKYSGATATPMPFAEVYLALKTNAVDGQENPLSTIDAQKFYEVQKYCALTGHIINDNNYIISKIVFDKLSPAQQEAITKATEEAAAFHTETFMNDEKALLEKFEENGMTITTPDKAVFRDACAPMYDEYIAEFGDAAVKAIEEARNK